MHERLKQLRKALGKTQTEFAEKLNVTQASIAGYETQHRVPTDRVISDICREFNVSEEWLRDGIGEMFIQRTRNQELAIWFNTVLADADDSIRKRMIAALSVLTTEEWEIVEKFAKKLTEGR